MAIYCKTIEFRDRFTDLNKLKTKLYFPPTLFPTTMLYLLYLFQQKATSSVTKSFFSWFLVYCGKWREKKLIDIFSGLLHQLSPFCFSTLYFILDIVCGLVECWRIERYRRI